MAERAGAITWACSEEDSGPDVGISVSLGDGTELWCGEVSRKLWSEALDDAAALGDDAGYWLVHWKPEPVIVGRCISLEAGQALIDTLAAAFTTHASEREAIGRAAGREEALREIKEPADELLDRVGEAMTRAQCPGREGPYGGYDYGHDEDFYGPAPKDGRYVVRDFRVVGSATWGAWVHQTPDRERHEDAFDRLTKRHVARAALLAALSVDGGKDGA